MGPGIMVGKYENMNFGEITKKVFIIERYFTKLEKAQEFANTNKDFRIVRIA